MASIVNKRQVGVHMFHGSYVIDSILTLLVRRSEAAHPNTLRVPAERNTLLQTGSWSIRFLVPVA